MVSNNRFSYFETNLLVQLLEEPNPAVVIYLFSEATAKQRVINLGGEYNNHVPSISLHYLLSI